MSSQPRNPAGTPVGGRFATETRGRSQTQLPDNPEPEGYVEPELDAVNAAVDTRIAADRQLEVVAGRALAAYTRANCPGATSIGLDWDDENQHPRYAQSIYDSDGNDITERLTDEDTFIDEANDLARCLRRRVNPDTIDAAPGGYQIVVPLAELESAAAEPAPSQQAGNLAGRTIARVEPTQVEGPYGSEPAMVLHFTDGSSHTFVQPREEDSP